ncbi:FAD-dependent oxidoreductase [Aliidongia dinghuensis]|uniref:FAD-dependent oxidoreductase n=1 Tax=Aliidongia dinghuensis TaxID=1867774 RepID=A0A8J2YY47_9PROT|nr:FAD-dependent monooxygenase [Aliidongia dinghuensis]GGF39312.1 FAD-dependent oxidoreductase [Aliidongia dinghuensis]
MTDDLLVVGGGPAGAALAIPLALAGRRVTLVERTSGPHDKVCGEFVSHEAIAYLAALGIEPAALGAVPIGRLRLAGRRLSATVALPFAAMSLSRRVLDEVLLARAATAGVRVRRGRRVLALEPTATGFSARLDDGTALAARQAVLATGKHDLRGHPRAPGRQNDLVGFKSHFRLAPDEARALAGHVELALFADGYAGLEPIEHGLANLCLVVRRARLAALGGTWAAVLAHVTRAVPLFGRRLACATAIQARPLTVAAIPYGFVSSSADRPDLWRIGDQAAVIPSFSGDGLSMALHSARLAADHLLAGRSAAAFQTQLAAELGAQVGRATMLSRLLVDPRAQGGLLLAAHLVPGLMRLVARATRVPAPALLAAT